MRSMSRWMDSDFAVIELTTKYIPNNTTRMKTPNYETYPPRLRKNGCTTSSQSEKSSKSGMKLATTFPCEKLSTVFVKTPNVSIFASIMHVSAAQNINIPPRAVADCPNVKKANINAPKTRLDLNLNGWLIARPKSSIPKPRPRSFRNCEACCCSLCSSARWLHSPPQSGQIFTPP